MGAPVLFASLLLASSTVMTYGQLFSEAYPGRSLLHDDWGHNNNNNGDCKCKNANWWCYGYCNLGTKSGDSQGCFRDCLVCCGWGAAPAGPQPQANPVPTPMPQTQATPQPQAVPQATQTPAAANNNENSAGSAGLTRSSAASPVVRVVQSGRRLQGSPGSPPNSPSWDGHGDGHHGDGPHGGDGGKKDPNQCWNSFWVKYPWK